MTACQACGERPGGMRGLCAPCQAERTARVRATLGAPADAGGGAAGTQATLTDY